MAALSLWHAALGATVRALRQDRGFSQADLGRRADLEQNYISGIERGIRNPSWAVIVALSEALRTSPTKLVAEAERRMSRGGKASP